MGSAHGDSPRDCVPFGYYILDLVVQIWKGSAQPHDELAHRFRATVLSRRGLMIEVVGSKQLIYDGVVALVEEFFKRATKSSLIFFSC